MEKNSVEVLRVWIIRINIEDNKTGKFGLSRSLQLQNHNMSIIYKKDPVLPK